MLDTLQESTVADDKLKPRTLELGALAPPMRPVLHPGHVMERELLWERQQRQQLQRKLEAAEEAITVARREVSPRSFVFAPSVAERRFHVAREQIAALKNEAEVQEQKRLSREEKLQDAVLEARHKLAWSKGATKEAIIQRDSARDQVTDLCKQVASLEERNAALVQELDSEITSWSERAYAAEATAARAIGEVASLIKGVGDADDSLRQAVSAFSFRLAVADEARKVAVREKEDLIAAEAERRRQEGAAQKQLVADTEEAMAGAVVEVVEELKSEP